MKKFLLIAIVLISITAFASNVLIYDTKTGRVKAYLRSVNTPDWEGKEGVLINPKLPEGVPLRYMKVENGKVRAMTDTEIEILKQEELLKRKQAELDRVSGLNIQQKNWQRH